jgi:hypothetical protein
MQLRALVLTSLLALVPAAASAVPVGSAFTYQGRLTDAGNPANGPYDLRLTLFDAAAGGAPVGSPITVDDAAVSQGLFTVSLDFGPAAFGADARWLELLPRRHREHAEGPEVRQPVLQRAQHHHGRGRPAGRHRRTVLFARDRNGRLPGDRVPRRGTPEPQGREVRQRGLQRRRGRVHPGGQPGEHGRPLRLDRDRGDGFPVNSYFDQTAGALKVAKCGDAACSAGNTLTTVDDPANTVGEHTAIAVPADGRPVVAYRDATAGQLKVLKCGNAACTAGNGINVVDQAFFVGQYTSMAIGADGLPIVSYFHTIGRLKVAKCGDATCGPAGRVVSVVDSPVNTSVGLYTSIAVPADGLPVISYHDLTNGSLKVAKCGNVACQ